MPSACAGAAYRAGLHRPPRRQGGYRDGLGRTRNATLWLYQIVVETEYNVLAILAGLNRLYFSAFQFKRLRKFVGKLRLAPADLAARLDALFRADPATTVTQLELLVRDTVALVEAHVPAVDTRTVRERLAWRESPWTPVWDQGAP